jgi:MoaA/NifB/PqqE/SkfB family radical SAM enzyme
LNQQNKYPMAPMTESEYRERFTAGLVRLFARACRISRFNPLQCLFWFRTWKRQKGKAVTRKAAETTGLIVPPVLIFSSTTRCNLHCRGCYADKGNCPTRELPLDRVRQLYREASDLGVGVIMIAGGEPLMRPEILWSAAEQKDIIFPVFTNGMLLNDGSIRYFRRHSNLFPVLSAEGGQERTDLRRGNGVYARVLEQMEKLRKAGKFFGLSITLTRENFDEVTHPVWIRSHHGMGCSLFFMVDYVPQSGEDAGLCLTPGQKVQLPGRLERLRKMLPALFISLPGDEERFGGCLAGGRGFVHISASGQLEACPFAPFSDTSVKEHSLRDALASPFLKILRDSHHMLGEIRGGCTLWENRDWVRMQLSSAGSRRETADAIPA